MTFPSITSIIVDTESPKLILFDFDGTLADSSLGIYTAFCAACAETTLKPPPIDLFRKAIGPPISEIFDHYFPSELPDAKVAFVSEFRKEYDSSLYCCCDWYEGVIAGIRSLASGGFILGVVTNKPTLPTVRLLQDANLIDQFALVAGIDARKTALPFPSKTMALSWALQQLSMLPEEAVYCGDTLADFIACRPLDLSFVGVTYGFFDWQTKTQNLAKIPNPNTPSDNSLLRGYFDCFKDVVGFFLGK